MINTLTFMYDLMKIQVAKPQAFVQYSHVNVKTDDFQNLL